MHYSVIVLIDADEKDCVEEAVAARMAPYQQNNMGDCPEEYLEFHDVTDEYLERFNTERTEMVRMDDGTLVSKYDERFRRKKDTLSDTGPDYVYPEGAKIESVLFKDAYPSFDAFMKDYAGYEQNEEGRYGYTENPNCFWDWYQLGGRWTGMFDPEYDPEKDPRNIKTCWLCKGTGVRDDEIAQKARLENPEYKCNGCNGTGKAVEWPTGWADFDGDVKPVSMLLQLPPETFKKIACPYYLVAEGVHHEVETYDETRPQGERFVRDDKWPEKCREIYERNKDKLAVVVDCHI